MSNTGPDRVFVRVGIPAMLGLALLLAAHAFEVSSPPVILLASLASGLVYIWCATLPPPVRAAALPVVLAVVASGLWTRHARRMR